MPFAQLAPRSVSFKHQTVRYSGHRLPLRRANHRRSGELHSVREACSIAFEHLGLDYREYVISDPRLKRSPEAAVLVGDAREAAATLGWRSRTAFGDLIRMMVDSDLEGQTTDAPTQP